MTSTDPVPPVSDEVDNQDQRFEDVSRALIASIPVRLVAAIEGGDGRGKPGRVTLNAGIVNRMVGQQPVGDVPRTPAARGRLKADIALQPKWPLDLESLGDVLAQYFDGWHIWEDARRGLHLTLVGTPQAFEEKIADLVNAFQGIGIDAHAGGITDVQASNT